MPSLTTAAFQVVTKDVVAEEAGSHPRKRARLLVSATQWHYGLLAYNCGIKEDPAATTTQATADDDADSRASATKHSMTLRSAVRPQPAQGQLVSCCHTLLADVFLLFASRSSPAALLALPQHVPLPK